MPAARSPVSGDEATDPEVLARAIVLRKLTMAPRTRAELEQALRQKDVPPETSDQVLDRFAEVGLVDDAKLAASFADARRERSGWSRRAIARKLRDRGVDREVVDETLESVSAEEELDTATQFVRSRWRRVANLEPQVRKRRLMAALSRRGYSTGSILEAMRVVEQEPHDDR